MSETRQPTDCDRFEDWLLDGEPGEASAWHPHLASCDGCRSQWEGHRMLTAAFAGQTAPELSPAFEAGLERKLAGAVRVKALRGWRLAALGGYALAAGALLRWIFLKFPPPAIDLASPWVSVAALIVVPLSFWLAIAATKWLPRQRPRGLRLFAL